MRRAGAEACHPEARREVILTPPLDREKNRCENGGTAAPDKPDYRVLNLHATCCVEVFSSCLGEQWTHALLEIAKPVTLVTGFLVWTAVA
jgi:hypothetical protein